MQTSAHYPQDGNPYIVRNILPRGSTGPEYHLFRLVFAFGLRPQQLRLVTVKFSLYGACSAKSTSYRYVVTEARTGTRLKLVSRGSDSTRITERRYAGLLMSMYARLQSTRCSAPFSGSQASPRLPRAQVLSLLRYSRYAGRILRAAFAEALSVLVFPAADRNPRVSVQTS